MDKITTIAVDLAKHVFEVAGEDRHGKVLLTQRLKSREAFYGFIKGLLAPLLVGRSGRERGNLRRSLA